MILQKKKKNLSMQFFAIYTYCLSYTMIYVYTPRQGRKSEFCNSVCVNIFMQTLFCCMLLFILYQICNDCKRQCYKLVQRSQVHAHIDRTCMLSHTCLLRIVLQLIQKINALTLLIVQSRACSINARLNISTWQHQNSQCQCRSARIFHSISPLRPPLPPGLLVWGCSRRRKLRGTALYT